MEASFSAKIDLLPQMLAWVRAQWVDLRLDAKTLYKIELATEEALANIIHHAYREQSGKIQLSVHIVSQVHMEIRIRDWGPLFNPLLNPPQIDLKAPLETRKEGGLGVFFLVQLMDDVFYESDGSSNLLILIKRFSQKR